MTFRKILWQIPLVVIIAMMVAIFTERLHLSFFQTDISEKLFTELVSKKDFTLLLFTLATLTPVLALLEELIFRFLPYKLWDKYLKRTINYWLIGFIASLLFAILGHTNFTNGIEIPLPQMILGIYLWSIVRYKNGYLLASFAHCYFNVLLALSVFFIQLWIL